MFKGCIIILFGISLISSVSCNGQFIVLHHPQSVLFKGHEHLKESILPEVYSAALGFSTQHFSNWPGMYIEDPFDLPKAIVTISVDGVSNIGQQKGHHFPLKSDMSEQEVYQALEKSIFAHYPTNSKLVRIDLSNGLEDIKKYQIFTGLHTENIKHISHKFLKLDVEEDRQFLKDIVLLHEVAHKVEHMTGKDDSDRQVFWFQLNSLHALSDLHGENSTETLEAKQLLNDVIVKLNAAFTKLYDGSVLVSIITSDATHTRRTRSILQTAGAEPADKSDKTKYNLATYYNQDYPVIFNIILWFMIALLFSLIAVCIAIGTMDPGRDSVIYRMTSTRMKKDN